MYTTRLKRIALYGSLILLVGVSYGLFVTLTGIGIPCFFNLVTGLRCPGCGITHMCIDLMHLDLHQAFMDHPVIFSLLPLWLVCLIKNIVQYIRTGRYQLTRIENLLIYASIAALLIYGIVRNF